MVEVASDKEGFERAQTSGAASAGKPAASSSKETLAKAQRNLKASGVGLELKESAKGMGIEGAATYIVQVGSFLEKENAEKLRGKLAAQGHDAVVRPFSHQSLGRSSLFSSNPSTTPREQML